MDLVSVIVPVYKVELYLEKCINSILSQSYRDLQIILVDDGSPDECGNICNSYAEKDSRIIVIHKQNEGLGMARNTGLNAATGKYVVFIDSDDWIDKDHINTLVTACKEYNADMAITGFFEFINENRIITKNITSKNQYYNSKQEILQNVLCPTIGSDAVKKNFDGREMCVWTNIYRKEIIDNNRFRFVSEREYLSEDFFFNLSYIHQCLSVVLLKGASYYYRRNISSLSNAYRSNKIQLLENMTKVADDLLITMDIKSYTGYRLQRAYFKRYRKCLLLLIGTNKLTYRKKYSELKQSINSDVTRKMCFKYPTFSVRFREGIFIWLVKHKAIHTTYSFIWVSCKLLKLRK